MAAARVRGRATNQGIGSRPQGSWSLKQELCNCYPWLRYHADPFDNLQWRPSCTLLDLCVSPLVYITYKDMSAFFTDSHI